MQFIKSTYVQATQKNSQPLTPSGGWWLPLISMTDEKKSENKIGAPKTVMSPMVFRIIFTKFNERVFSGHGDAVIKYSPSYCLLISSLILITCTFALLPSFSLVPRELLGFLSS